VPIYEYRCEACGRKNNIFVRTVSSPIGELTCGRCGGHDLRRLFSRFAVAKGATDEGEAIYQYDKLGSGLDEDDPKSMARWAKRVSQDLGEDFGEEFNETMGRIAEGEDPDTVIGDGGSDE
jgi:putative FmdB family regulatory protein